MTVLKPQSLKQKETTIKRPRSIFQLFGAYCTIYQTRAHTSNPTETRNKGARPILFFVPLPHALPKGLRPTCLGTHPHDEAVGSGIISDLAFARRHELWSKLYIQPSSPSSTKILRNPCIGRIVLTLAHMETFLCK